MSGDHNQYQKDRSYLDDRREDSYVQLVDDECDRIVWRNQSFRLPIEWVGLTYEEIQTIHDTYYRRMGPQEFARAIEDKLRKKNT